MGEGTEWDASGEMEMAADRLSLGSLRRRSTALILAAVGSFSLAISYVVPVASTLAAGGSTISPLRQLVTPTLEFPPLKAPRVTRAVAELPPLVAVHAAPVPAR